MEAQHLAAAGTKHSCAQKDLHDWTTTGRHQGSSPGHHCELRLPQQAASHMLLMRSISLRAVRRASFCYA